MKNNLLKQIKFNKEGLLPAVVQDAASGKVVMMAYMNKASLMRTLQTGKVHFYSRSRKNIWLKGETSGHIQKVREIYLDCDGDAVLIKVAQTGGACHEGYFTCFFMKAGSKGWKVVEKKVFNPEKVYR